MEMHHAFTNYVLNMLLKPNKDESIEEIVLEDLIMTFEGQRDQSKQR